MQLNRRQVVQTAMKMIEADGVETVSMNRLATELGCGMLALYSQVPSRSALLDRVSEAVLSAVEPPEAAPGASWADELRAQAGAVWQAARRYPRCGLVALARPAATAGTVRIAEHALATLAAAGISGQEAVRVLRVLRAYLVGSLACAAGIAPGLRASDRAPHLRASEFPHVLGLAGMPGGGDPDADLVVGLDLLLHAVACRAS